MRYFTRDSRLRASSRPLRVTLTGFLVFAALGYVSNFALLAWKTGMTPEGVAHYYRGFEPPPGSDAPFQYAKEWRELLEVSHFHLYIVPVVLLILTHVFFLTPWSERAKVGVTGLAYAAALADLAAPWLVRYGGAGFAWWKLLSSVAYHGTLAFLVGACLWDLWRPGPGAGSGTGSGARSGARPGVDGGGVPPGDVETR